MTKKGVRSVLLVLMVVALLTFCGVHHVLANEAPCRPVRMVDINTPGDLTQVSSSSGLQTFTYDTLRRLANTTDPTDEYSVEYMLVHKYTYKRSDGTKNRRTIATICVWDFDGAEAAQRSVYYELVGTDWVLLTDWVPPEEP